MSKRSEKPASFQFSLAVLIGLMTIIGLSLGSIRSVGFSFFVMAVVPPFFLGIMVNSVMSLHIYATPRGRPGRFLRWAEGLSTTARVLLGMVLGYVLWIPCWLAVTLTW